MRAQTPAITGVTSSKYSLNSWTWGWQFTVGSSDILVTHLGTWDRYNNGLAVGHNIGIWATSNQALLGSTVLSAETAHPLESGFRWKELETPILLSANTTYRIGDYAASGGEDVLLAGFTMNPQFVSVQGSYSAGQSFEYPEWSSAGLVYLGANFKFGPADPVPEPALLQLPFLLCMGGAGYWFRRRTREARS